MDRIGFYISFYFEELRLKKWYFLLMAWMISILGIFFITLIPDQYRTYAGISIDTDRLLSQVIGDSAFSMDRASRSQAIKVSQIIYSTDNLRKVLREIDPDSHALSRRKEMLIVENIRNNLTFKDVSKDYYELSYYHSNPDVAYRTLKAILANFIEANIKKLSSNSEEAEIISTDSLKVRQREYALLQKAFTKFQQENIEIIDPNGALLLSLSKAQNFVSDYPTIRQKHIRRVGNLKNLIIQTPKNIESQRIVDPACDLSEFIKKRNTLLARGFTQSHPDVVYVENIINSIKKECPEANNRTLKISNNPAYLQLVSELQIAQEELKTHEDLLRKYKNEIQKIKIKLTKQPIILEKLETLERQKNKAQKSLGVADLQNDRLQETIDLNRKTGLVKYDIVQRVYYPIKPEKPNRLLLFIGCLLASIFGAAGFIILRVQLEQRMPTIFHIREAFDLPILGSISKIKKEDDKGFNLKDIFLWVTSFALLFFCYGVLIWYYTILLSRPDFSSFFDHFRNIINLVI